MVVFAFLNLRQQWGTLTEEGRHAARSSLTAGEAVSQEGGRRTVLKGGAEAEVTGQGH